MRKYVIIIIVLVLVVFLVGCADEPTTTTTVVQPTTTTTQKVVIVTTTVTEPMTTTTTVAQPTTTTTQLATTTNTSVVLSKQERALSRFVQKGSWEEYFPEINKTVTFKLAVESVEVRDNSPEHLQLDVVVGGVHFMLQAMPGGMIFDPNDEPAWSRAVYNSSNIAQVVLTEMRERISVK